MQLKTNLHFHTADDPRDRIPYTAYEGIDAAARLGFEVLAMTCHNKVAHTQEYAQYAKEKNILLISGIELDIGETPGETRHLVVLNCDTDAERIQTFDDLRAYKDRHPQIFVLAPHPYYPYHTRSISLHKYTDRYAHLLDAIEHSWFYSRTLNFNRRAEQAAFRHNLPLIATSDTHTLEWLDSDYCVIETSEKSPEAVFAALRQRAFVNITRPKKLLREMLLPLFFRT
jgi:predicted metal-dependent phosphoesterase TrpH